MTEQPGITRNFQMRAIGTRDVQFKTVLTRADAASLFVEHGKVFILSNVNMIPREDGGFDVDIMFVPGNGMAVVYEPAPIVNTAGETFVQSENGGG